MRSDRHRNKEKTNTGFKRFTRFWAIFYLLSAAVFFGVLIYADVLTFEYLCIAGGDSAGDGAAVFSGAVFQELQEIQKDYLSDSYNGFDSRLWSRYRIYERDFGFLR